MPGMTMQQAFDLAVQHHQAGRLKEAEGGYRKILEMEPLHAGALHHLGVIAHHAGRSDLAVNLIQQALLSLPLYSDAHNSLGIVLEATGRLEEGIAAYRMAVNLKPDCPDFLKNLGYALGSSGNLDEALAALQKAIDIRPGFAEAHLGLGTALREKHQYDGAIDAFSRAIALNPGLKEAYGNLRVVLQARGRLDEAIAIFMQALALEPDSVEVMNDLGIALSERGRSDEAVVTYRRAIALKPDYHPADNNLGNTLREMGKLDEAVAAYDQALGLLPDSWEINLNSGNALRDRGDLDEALAAYGKALALRPGCHHAHSNILYCLHFLPGSDAAPIAEEHRLWSQRHAVPLREHNRPHSNDRSPERRLRIGYISPDLRLHSVSFFLDGLLEQHDRTMVDVFCYSDTQDQDSMTARLCGHGGNWRRISGLADPEVAGLIRGDRIDILVDLAGHTANNRLSLFARKPAPVQVTWLGYPNTTGLDTMDYRVTDACADPPGQTEQFHSEQLVRLPRSAWCYQPPRESPPVGPPPFRVAGHVTFGCFNALPKINKPLLQLWAEILIAVPGSRLLLKNNAMGEGSVRQRLIDFFGISGISPERLELIERMPDFLGHLALYGRVDIALDTFPYHGTTTTCEALWMGVPVVTLGGETHVPRVGVSLLSNLGRREWIATTRAAYVDQAVRLAGDFQRLAGLRATLREELLASPIMDAPAFARDMEAAYRKMWRTWCGRLDSPSCPE